jgi:uncharacterized membrane protein YphA (DoxX/SURF4 family)
MVRQGQSSKIAPLLLRLVLGLTFLWAGLGKFNAYDEVKGEQAARLANVGVLELPKSSSDPKGDHAGPESGAQPTAPSATPTPKLMYSAADFPEPVRVRRMHTSVTLRLLEAAEPREIQPGQPPRSIWPAFAAGSNAPILAWVVAITDIAGGVCLLLGLLTRLWAIVLAGHMAVGMWLLLIGPAWRAGDAVLGFLPRHDPWDTAFWMNPLWILALLSMNLALVFLGAGSISLDRPLLGEAVRPQATN